MILTNIYGFLEKQIIFMYQIMLGFSVSLVVEWLIPIQLTRVRFPDEEFL